jgi:hypothetical protein
MEFKMIDLDINNYNLDDLLVLFRLEPNFNENSLKIAKKMVLKMHPDKSHLEPKYFLFFSKAYKVLYNIFIFKNKTKKQNNENIEYITHEINSDEEKRSLDIFFKKNKNLKNTNNFNKWFNDEFEKNKLSSETEMNGYGDWLKSEDDLLPVQTNMSQTLMNNTIQQKKRDLSALIVKYDIKEQGFIGSNTTGALIWENNIENYSSNMFSSLPYQDLKQAHIESVIPVCEDDYNKIQKFNNVDEYIQHRSVQMLDSKPLSEKQALIYLKNKELIIENEGAICAFELAKQYEKSQDKLQGFWSQIKQIKY